jgi:cytochrome c
MLKMKLLLVPGLLVALPAIGLVLALVAGAASSAAAEEIVADEEAGAELYESVCKGCHAVSIGPTLRGVIGRPIASVASFAGYSEALKSKRALTWTAESLDAFLQAPAEFAPGTLMTQAVPEAQRRADLIAFLATLPPPRE